MQYMSNTFLTPTGDANQLMIRCDGVDATQQAPMHEISKAEAFVAAAARSRAVSNDGFTVIPGFREHTGSDCSDHGGVRLFESVNVSVLQCAGRCTSGPGRCECFDWNSETGGCRGTNVVRLRASNHGRNAWVNTSAPPPWPPPGGATFTEWQAAGWDKGSTVGKWPTPAGIEAMVRGLLQINEAGGA